MQDPRPDVFPHLVDLPTYISPCDGPFGSGGRQPLIDIHVLYRVYINICTDDRSGEMLCHQVDSKFSSDSLTLQFELLKLDDLKSASIIHLKREHGPYPIAEIIQTACASTTSEVLWHYKLREPNQPPNRGSFMPGLGGSFAAFHSAAMLSTEEAKISVRIIMQKDQECCTVTVSLLTISPGQHGVPKLNFANLAGGYNHVPSPRVRCPTGGPGRMAWRR
ncbi:hypothetical protein Pst134EB_023465 [Puccinia striiformis f. sp. tritici]|nr:hypothetical protein Pst134EB_023465 [Puccinia striiformis f. sp. tritici]